MKKKIIEAIMKEALLTNDNYTSNLDTAEKLIKYVKTRYGAGRLSLQSVFSTIHMYIEKAQKELK